MMYHFILEQEKITLERSGMEGASLDEIKEVEQKIKVQFPQSYVELLNYLGKSQGDIIFCDYYITLDYLEQMQFRCKRLLSNITSSHFFAFMENQGYSFRLFNLDDKSEDPAVYLIIEKDNGDIDLIIESESLSDYIYKSVIYYLYM